MQQNTVDKIVKVINQSIQNNDIYMVLPTV